MAATLRARSRHRLERSLASGDERGTDVWLKLPGLESLHAQVVWMRGHLLGCEFARPLHPAVLDMVVRNARH